MADGDGGKETECGCGRVVEARRGGRGMVERWRHRVEFGGEVETQGGGVEAQDGVWWSHRVEFGGEVESQGGVMDGW
ncbi:hypothetical protein Pmani_018273 [Petrolisthes manimaculis]|uniref:Uncharacterized protein n=1 Tax=Petrolisthes manimaculis TaxID=1843537 RepID=A0AAE1U8J3_9EUCA|nr:hypothetical protein Pmani_018273 [Petrolisthes manimaculis]